VKEHPALALVSTFLVALLIGSTIGAVAIMCVFRRRSKALRKHSVPAEKKPEYYASAPHTASVEYCMKIFFSLIHLICLTILDVLDIID
jgi:hypothetical protein